MVVERHLASLIRTKLHHPQVHGDIVCRQGLHGRMDENRDRQLTLVNHWLEKSEIPSAWLSLGEDDSDLGED